MAKYPEATAVRDQSQAFDYVQNKAFRVAILDTQEALRRPRPSTEIRRSRGEVGLLPALARLRALRAAAKPRRSAWPRSRPATKRRILDGYTGGETSKRFILHYNFPPFSVGETGRIGGPGRREIGHGALAERSVEPVIPTENGFPVRHPRLQRDHGIERLDLDGLASAAGVSP